MKRKADFKLQRIGGDVLLVPLAAQVKQLNGIITLNDVAACLWDQLAEDRSVDQLAASVLERFDVTAGIALDDVRVFVAEMTRLGLVEP